MKIGFIGAGNMGSAMIAALFAKNNAEKVVVFARSKTDEMAQKFGVIAVKDEIEVIKNSDMIFLATKPNTYEKILNLIKNELKDKILITLAPNFTISQSLEILGKTAKVARAMPNTPTAIAQGVSAISFSTNLSKTKQDEIREIFQNFGRVYELEESKFGAFTAIAGSLPAYVFMFIEAVADAGVKNGIAREQTYEIIAASVAGSANLMLESKKHPAVLKDEVCSPGGTTIEAVSVLEKLGFRSALIEAVHACAKKANGR
ncbi:pyrroline-5-carboxylate reductase [Campylobacter sp. 9BO]|uniref:pyrroline-5-carboxylate reductase n=1 Tax=Campylobacter sp. 9BO TaxID=3424759 RepID=UPI003D326CC9